MNTKLYRPGEIIEVPQGCQSSFAGVEAVSADFAAHVEEGKPFVVWTFASGCPAYGGLMALCRGDHKGNCWTPVDKYLILSLPAGWEQRPDDLTGLANAMLETAENGDLFPLCEFLGRHGLRDAYSDTKKLSSTWHHALTAEPKSEATTEVKTAALPA